MDDGGRLLLAAVLGLLEALLFAYVGRLVLRRRPRDGDDRRALRQFATWWIALAVMASFQATRTLLAARHDLDVAVHAALVAASYAPLALALWGLTSYLAYVYRGHHRAQRLLVAYHAALFLGLVLLMTWTRPARVEGAWSPRLVHENPLGPVPVLLLVLAILGPALVGALAYGRLYFRVDDPRTRRRILLVSVAFAGWFGATLLANVTSLAGRPAWPLAARVLAVACTLLLLVAYRGDSPPAPET